ncbi:MAG: phosphate/phosphite/phosphonate ABC transporter substrate-binding protein [Acidimicrobiales bacterium]|jgi:phosphonate transport system substrate-binding protein|nr:phosphate/phosphite/phosphonate ABC transporter substrate-binding protein [Acidimicrobiales bacterium]|tara:strand:- start:3168 stop:4142 length:975 start_codon:yes stop_codon:yes gene_type:complete
MFKRLLALGLAAVLPLVAACGSGSPDEITISLVPSVEGQDLAEALGPLTAYLSDNLGIEVKGVVATDYSATVEALGANQADVIITDAGSLFSAITRYDAQLILRDIRFGASSYASIAMTNNPDKYCADEPVLATYAASGIELSYCNGTEQAATKATGIGPVSADAIGGIAKGTRVALQAATSPAGFQYPIMTMREGGIDTDNDIKQIPVEGNNNAVLAVYNGDAEVGFAYWDARTTVRDEAPDIAEKVVVFAYTDMVPNGGVAVSPDLPADLVTQLTNLMDGYADSSEEAASVMYDLVGLSDWTPAIALHEITRYGEVLAQFAE